MKYTNKSYGNDDFEQDLNRAMEMFLSQIEFVVSERKSVLDGDFARKQIIRLITPITEKLKEYSDRT